MRNFMSLPLIVCAALFFSSTRCPAGLFDASVTVRAEAGLDAATREFIATLPDTWRPKLANIVNDTMNRVDVSFKSYVEQVDRMISAQVIEIQCHVLATEKSIVDDIVKRFPWVNQAGPMERLRDQVRSSDARRQSDSSPTFIKDLYNDLMLAASVVTCQNGDIPTAQADTRKIINGLRDKWLVWNRLEHLKCKEASQCMADYSTTIRSFLQSSDARDVKSANAQASFAAIKQPDTSKWKIWRTVDFNQIEGVLTQLYIIENAIGGARAIRELQAMRGVDRAQESTQKAKKDIDTAYNEVKSLMNPTVMAIPEIGGIGGGLFGGIKMSIRHVTVAGKTCQQIFDLSRPKLASSAAALGNAKKELDTARTTSDIVTDDANKQNEVIAAQMKRTGDAPTFCKGA